MHDYSKTTETPLKVKFAPYFLTLLGFDQTQLYIHHRQRHALGCAHMNSPLSHPDVVPIALCM